MTSVAAETWFSAPALTRVFDLLNADGGEVRVVGGAVRNSLMGLPVADIDMATTLLPDEVVARAKKAGIKVGPDGHRPRHGDAGHRGRAVRGDDAAPRRRDRWPPRRGSLRVGLES